MSFTCLIRVLIRSPAARVEDQLCCGLPRHGSNQGNGGVDRLMRLTVLLVDIMDEPERRPEAQDT